MQVEPGTFPTLLRQNVAIALDDLIKKHGPNITSQAPAELLAAGRWEGKQYGIPRNIDKRGITEAGMLARKDILQELGIAAPLNVDQFYAALQKVKQGKPGIIPYSYEAGPIPVGILSGFGLTDDWHKRDGKWVLDIKTPAYLECVTFLNKLYREGLLDQEMPAMKMANRREKFAAGKVAFIHYGSGDYYMFDALKKNVPGAAYLYMAVLQDRSGKGHINVLSGYNAVSFVPKTARYAVDAIKWINTTVEPATFRTAYIGTEGQTFQIVDGQYRPIFPAFNDFNKRYYFFALYDDAMAPTYWKGRLWKTPLTAESYLAIDKLNEPSKEVSPVAFAPQFASVAQYGDVAALYKNDEILKFIVGTRSLSEWGRFLQELDAKGGAQIEKEQSAWLASSGK